MGHHRVLRDSCSAFKFVGEIMGQGSGFIYNFDPGNDPFPDRRGVRPIKSEITKLFRFSRGPQQELSQVS